MILVCISICIRIRIRIRICIWLLSGSAMHTPHVDKLTLQTVIFLASLASRLVWNNPAPKAQGPPAP